MTALLWLVALSFSSEVDDLRSTAEQYPEDYAAQVAWAQAAMLAGDGEQALEAWRAAQAISGPTYEACAGHVAAQVVAGHVDQARREAASLTEAFPDVAGAWTLRADLAWAGGEPTALAALRADPWRVRAAALSPDPNTACSSAVNAAALGDRTAARARMTDPGACPDLAADLRDRWSAWGGLWAVGLGQTGTSRTFDYGVAGVAQVGASWDQTVAVDATVRTLGWHINPAVTTGWTEQYEGWLRVTGQRRGAGATVIAGGIWPGGTTTFDAPAWALGGRAWGTAWATFLVEGGFARYSDADAWQLGGTVAMPVWRSLVVTPGVQYSHLAPESDAAVEGWSGSLAVDWKGPAWEAGVTGRYGTEHRPIRYGEPSVWNQTAPLLGSVDLRGAVRLRRGLWLSGSYGLVVLDSTDSTTETAQMGALGVVITDDISRR